MESWASGFWILLLLLGLGGGGVRCSVAQMPGFTSIDCGGLESFTDELGLQWVPDYPFTYGKTANIFVPSESRHQYKTLRYFPADDRKYCYTLNVTSRVRYLVRATFLYGNFDNNNVYPKFDVSLGATPWSTIVISDANVAEMIEMIFLAQGRIISVCLSNATTGQPFISTLELRQFNGSVYYTDFENQYYLSVSARVNFGSSDTTPVRYPDDPFDRIWQSDSLKKANYLVDVAPGTEKVSTTKQIYVDTDDRPPNKVMQTAVVGRYGTLSYRLNLDGFPGAGWAYTYFAEIEDLDLEDTRRFKLFIHELPELSRPTVNIIENAGGKYRLYEPGYENISFPFVLSFKFNKTSDSTQGPLVNAMEINKYIQKIGGSLDEPVVASLISNYSSVDWAQEGGDPCLPVPWTWIRCNSGPQPLIVSVRLSQKNLSGNIPPELAKLSGLEELWLDGNSIVGEIADFSGCPNLRVIHLENNKLQGQIPSSLTHLQNLRELYLQNNMLSGTVPSGLLKGNIIINYSGNARLHAAGRGRVRTNVIIGVSCGASILVLAVIVTCVLVHKRKTTDKKPSRQDSSTDSAHYFSYSELVEATKNFERQIGSGGFGVVYYGKLKGGKEVAVKILTSNSHQGRREFVNEVTLLSRIHHKNLVQFLGYCQGEDKNILIYEFMHNGTLKEHLYGPLAREQGLSWIQRLEIAEDAAKGVEYLHTGCVPSIIHRDLKTNNILLDNNMRAKVSDFGLSKLANDGSSHVSSNSNVKGTVGYVDPEYYISQQFTEKSDVYSFGVVLLELISGKEAISNESFGAHCRNIVQWAKLHIERGDLQGIIDPTLVGEYSTQSMWKIAEKALHCVRPHKDMRPSMSDVLKEIQEAISMERNANAVREGDSSHDLSEHSLHSSIHLGSSDMGPLDNYLSFDESLLQPSAR
ncbi:putative LRR receptor-like serine/threonine-protein kinase [Drosera capensis]